MDSVFLKDAYARADAAESQLSTIIERAAQVAEEFLGCEIYPDDACRNVAAAIRQLKEGK